MPPMRTIWKMSSAEPAATYPAEPSTGARGGLHPVQVAGAEPDFMVDDEDDGFDWDFAQPPESASDPVGTPAGAAASPDLTPDFSHEPPEREASATAEPAPPIELAAIAAPASADAEQPEQDEQPAPGAAALLAEQPELVEQRAPAEPVPAREKAPSWYWPAAMALLVAVVVALLFVVRQQLDAPPAAPAPMPAAEAPLEPKASFPVSPVYEPEAPAPVPQVRAAPISPPPPAAATTASRTAPHKQKAAAAAPQSKRQRPPRRAQAQQPAVAPADTISCILPGGQETQASYSSCRARGGVIYR
jgi:hypothetical protein